MCGASCFYSSQNIIRVIESRRQRLWATRHVRGRVYGCKVFSGKPEGNKPLERPGHRCDIVKMALKGMGWEDVDWIPVALNTPMVVQKYVVKVLTGLYHLRTGFTGVIL
jgi:hypothetical protein